MEVLQEKKDYTDRILDKLIRNLEQELSSRRDEAVGEHTCIYATGSCGRGDMTRHSDLDAYVVRRNSVSQDVDDFVENAIVAANAQTGLPSLDANGHHIKPIAAVDLIDRLGAPEDDSREDGAFTKRMLLLLESRVLVGHEAYAAVIGKVVEAYWQNSELHSQDYQPFVLVNDIVRWWRIVLLNHESRLRKRAREVDEEHKDLSPDEKNDILLSERRYRSYKMRVARCLTCFSALLYLLSIAPEDDSHVTKEQVLEMVDLRPVDRIQQLGTGKHQLSEQNTEKICELISLYEKYLQRMDLGKKELLEKLKDDETFAKALSKDGGRFTELMFELVQDLGGGRRLHRHMLV
jgi:hypothetical protein